MKVTIDLSGSSSKWTPESFKRSVRNKNNQRRKTARELKASISNERWAAINAADFLVKWDALNLTDNELDVITDLNIEKWQGDYVLCCNHKTGDHEVINGNQVCWNCYYSEQKPEEEIDKMGRKKFSRYQRSLTYGRHKMIRAA